MNALLRAELGKVRSVRLFWGAIAAGMAVTAVFLGLQLVNAGRAGTASFGTPQGAVNVLAAGGRSALVAVVLGVLVVTAEFRYQTIATTFLVTPRRRHVMVAKVVTAAVLGLVLALVTFAFSAAVGLGTGAFSGDALNSAVLGTVAGATLAIVLYAVLGAAFATLVPNQTVAVAAVLLWFLVGETLLGSFGLGWLQPWTPAGATRALALDASLVGALPPWGGAALLIGYGVMLAGVGIVRLTRRDIT
jgi:ABC-type transport system involved in multi-copper enzyme maturation permease subunit